MGGCPAGGGGVRRAGFSATAAARGTGSAQNQPIVLCLLCYISKILNIFVNSFTSEAARMCVVSSEALGTCLICR